MINYYHHSALQASVSRLRSYGYSPSCRVSAAPSHLYLVVWLSTLEDIQPRGGKMIHWSLKGTVPGREVECGSGATHTRTPMSGTAGDAPPTAVIGLGLDIGGPCHVQKSGTLVQTCLLTSSVQPPPPAGGGNRGSRAPLRLPSLKASARGRGRRGSMARLSLSEPSLLTLNENIHFDGFSNIQWPGVLQKRHPPPPPTFSKSPGLLSSKTWHPPLSSSQNCSSRPTSTYIHFSQAIQPSTRSRRHSHNRTLSVDTATQLRDFSSQRELLSVIGKPCLPSCSQRSAPGPAPVPAPGPAAGPGRTQLHVFLPTEVEGEEVDSESVDEGFMDELDSKITSLKLQ